MHRRVAVLHSQETCTWQPRWTHGTVPKPTAPMTPEEKKVIFASSPRHRVRVVRLLPVRFARRDHRASSSSPASMPARAFIFALLAFAAGFIVRPFGAICLRPPGRHDRPQVHLPGHHPDHGPVDLHRRHPAHLRHHRRRRAGHPDRAAPAAGPGARRRVRRRRHLRGRARAARQARRLHLVDPDHGDAGPVPVAAGDPGHAHR